MLLSWAQEIRKTVGENLSVAANPIIPLSCVESLSLFGSLLLPNNSPSRDSVKAFQSRFYYPCTRLNRLDIEIAQVALYLTYWEEETIILKLESSKYWNITVDGVQSVSSKRQGLGSISTVTASESVTVPVTASESVMVPVTASESVTVPITAPITARSFTRSCGLSLEALMLFLAE